MKHVPLLIGAGNSKDMTGAEWSWWRRNAEKLGVPLVRIGTKSFARGADILAALDRQASKPEPLSDVTELEAFRRRVASAG